MEYFDVVDEAGQPTGKTVSRENAHTYGILHRTAHVWIVRQADARLQVLLQKRSMEKDSFPGLYDTSSAGHIPAGQGTFLQVTSQFLLLCVSFLRNLVSLPYRSSSITRGHFVFSMKKNFTGICSGIMKSQRSMFIRNLWMQKLLPFRNQK